MKETQRERKKETLKRIANSKSCLHAQRTTWSPPPITLFLTHSRIFRHTHTDIQRDAGRLHLTFRSTRFHRIAHALSDVHTRENILSSLLLSFFHLSFCRPFCEKRERSDPVFTSFAHALSLPLCRSLSIYRTTSVVFGLFPAYPFDIWFIPSTAHRVLRVVRFDYHTMDCRPIVKRNALAVKHDEITFG